MLYDKKKELIKKYEDVLDAVGKAHPQGEDCHDADLGVALILMEQAMALDGGKSLEGVPESFDWDAFAADLAASK